MLWKASCGGGREKEEGGKEVDGEEEMDAEFILHKILLLQ